MPNFSNFALSYFPHLGWNDKKDESKIGKLPLNIGRQNSHADSKIIPTKFKMDGTNIIKEVNKIV